MSFEIKYFEVETLFDTLQVKRTWPAARISFPISLVMSIPWPVKYQVTDFENSCRKPVTIALAQKLTAPATGRPAQHQSDVFGLHTV